MHHGMRIIAGSLLSSCLWTVVATASEPRAEWKQYATPEEAGFASDRLEVARKTAEESGSAAVFVVYRGHVLAAWGDVERPFQCHSVRKSLLSALYGIAVDKGRIDLSKTLAELGIDDRPALTDTEKQATVRDLIMARSGVYHPAAYEPSDMSKYRPARSSHKPGEYFWYNNWDFNTAGVIFERRAGLSIFEAFKKWIAGPIDMEDFRLADTVYHYEPCSSMYPAYLFRLSARDLARFGWLYARGGDWNGRQVVPGEWIEESTKPLSPARGGAYGYMWWVFPAGSPGDMLPTLSKYDKFIASGTGSQWLLVVPEADFVFVNRGDTEVDPQGPHVPAWRLAEMILAARTAEPKDNPTLVPVEARSFANASPAPPERKAIELDPKVLARYVGAYKAPEFAVDVHLHDGRLFVLKPDEGETELFPQSEQRFFSKSVPLQVTFETDESGHATAASVEYAGQNLRLSKVP